MVIMRKDILQFLKIENVFIMEPIKCFCNIIEISLKKWVVTVDQPILETENGLINIKIDNMYYELSVSIRNVGNLLYVFERIDTEYISDCIKELDQKIYELEENNIQWEKRKEERYTILEENASLLGLSQPTQTVIYNSLQLPCVLNNISYSGASLFIMSRDSINYKINKEIGLVLKFVNPIEQIILKGRIKSVGIKTIQNINHSIFGIISLEFIDGPLAYKVRLNHYIKSHL